MINPKNSVRAFRRNHLRLGVLVSTACVFAGCDSFPFQPAATTIEFKRSGCLEQSLSVTFTAITVDSNRTFQWFFTDGTVLLGQTVVHTFALPRTYGVTLIAGAETVQTKVTVPVLRACDDVPDSVRDRRVPNEGGGHVPEGTVVDYESNPPASGPHYSGFGLAPVAAGFYEEALRPERWVHNLEHGYVVVLYDCPGDCDPSFLAQLQSPFNDTPPSKFGTRKMVITRYAGLQPSIMAVAWDVQRDFDTFDNDGILAFYVRRVDQGPEDLP